VCHRGGVADKISPRARRAAFRLDRQGVQVPETPPPRPPSRSERGSRTSRRRASAYNRPGARSFAHHPTMPPPSRIDSYRGDQRAGGLQHLSANEVSPRRLRDRLSKHVRTRGAWSPAVDYAKKLIRDAAELETAPRDQAAHRVRPAAPVVAEPAGATTARWTTRGHVLEASGTRTCQDAPAAPHRSP